MSVCFCIYVRSSLINTQDLGNSKDILKSTYNSLQSPFLEAVNHTASYFRYAVGPHILSTHFLCDLWVGSGQRGRYSNSLWPGRSEDRVLVQAKFSTPIQTGPGTHPASYTIPLPLHPLWAFVACSRVNFTFTFTFFVIYINHLH